MLRFGALFSVIAAACSGPSIRFEDLDQEMQQARCERAARCKLFPDEASCLAFFRVVPDTSLVGAVAAHKVNYNGEAAKQCVDATARLSCDLTARDAHVEPRACTGMLTGSLAGGESCSFGSECASGTCNLPESCPPTGCCVGTCRPLQSAGKTGDACAKNHECRDGLICAKDMTCHTPAAEGDVCGLDRECSEGLGCVGAMSTMLGNCRALAHIGQPCPYLRCADENLRCDGATHTCVEVGLTAAPCPLGNECASGLQCDANAHTCREFPTLGMPCDSFCGGDAFCSFDRGPVGTCVAPLANTSPCDGYNQCASFYCEQGPIFDSCKDAYVCF